MVRGKGAGLTPPRHMEAHHLIQDISVCIVAAWLLSLIARAIRLPLMIAYLAADGSNGAGTMGMADRI